MSDPLIYNKAIEREKASQRKEVKMNECAFCELDAVSGVDAIEGNEYYSVCADDLARLIADFGMVAVELDTEVEYCDCGCRY